MKEKIITQSLDDIMGDRFGNSRCCLSKIVLYPMSEMD